ncbi:multidrug resistance-associated ABC transporter [Cyathus striatus]|nr:multidrug resistance-associated ABC transporter [Cyathus striatus]
MQVYLGRIAKMYDDVGVGEHWALDPQILPLYATGASLLVLSLQIAYAAGRSSSTTPVQASVHTPKHVRLQGNVTTLSFKAARFLGCSALLSLSIVTSASHRTGGIEGSLSFWEKWIEWSLPIAFLYASFLSGVSLFSAKWGRITTRHNLYLLLFISSIYAYRDFWPFMTTTGIPQDISEGSLLWAKIALLTFVAIFIPLFIPREYVPVNSNEPMEEPNAEQTASTFSGMLYFYLDTLMFKASKVEHLPYEELPVLADYDRATYLREKGFPHLDPLAGAKESHLFFKIIRTFRARFIILCFNVVFQVLATFAAPLVSTDYLERGEESTEIRPYFWIAWIFIGPMAYSVARQAYIFISTGTGVQAESLITQLVFEHSLRIRVKPETSGSELAADSASSSGTSTPVADAAPAAPKKKSSSDNMIGKLNNLVTSDLSSISGARDFLLVVLYVPLQVGLSIVFLYNILGISAFIGLFTVIALMPVPRLLVNKLASLEDEKMKLTDARVQAVTETVSSLRMLKMFAWEWKMNEKIQESRKSELIKTWKIEVWTTLSNSVNNLIGACTILTTFGFYTIVMKQELDASKVFSSMPVFDQMMIQLSMLTFLLGRTISELLDAYASTGENVYTPVPDTDVVGFNDAIFSWAKEEDDGAATPSFRLRVPGELIFKNGCMNLITGPTGSGKTSLLMALLGEMHFVPSLPNAWFNLPRDGGVAYASQESWVMNDTIKNNVLFGSPFDEERYNKVLQQCALKQDLELFDASDATEVGERGLTLSGRQKARITLARAVYSSAQVILLDDVLAALDVHTAKWIVEECLLGDLIKGRTVLLVTHNVALTEPIAHFIVSINKDGSLSTRNSVPMDHLPKALVEELEDIPAELDATKETTENDSSAKPSGKLIIREEIKTGRVGRKALKLFISALAGKHPFFFFPLWVMGMVASEVMISFQLWYLGHWGSQYENQPGEAVKASYYLSIYTSLLVFTALVQFVKALYYKLGAIRASTAIHNTLMGSVLGTTLRWLDETPVSRIITRCTQDIRSLDGPLSETFDWVVDLSIGVMTKLGSVVIISPIFIFPGMFIAGVGSLIANIYLKAQLSVKREMSNAKAPVLAHFGATVNALVSSCRMSWDLNRWIGIRMDLLGATFTTSLALYLVITRSASAANTGFSLAVALDFCNYILGWVRLYNDFEVEANSLERIQSYTEIDQEKRPTEAGKPPAAWPTSGELRVEKLSARYSADSPEVLHQLSFQIRSGERVGVVGRTGSGKSTLTLSLLRCILTDGHVYYDGIATDGINLDALRSNITIIPQVPELLSGTLRRNLDPFGEHDDAVLNAALKYAGLFSLQSESDDVRITLDTKISSGGSNLSVGQRQIIALSRAMVRESKLLILDEDYKTDALIQDALRSKLGSDVTVITIAHRLQTIMDADKIMVLDAGKLVEFDSPATLLRKEDSIFKGLVDNSGHSDELRAIAFGKARKQ